MEIVNVFKVGVKITQGQRTVHDKILVAAPRTWKKERVRYVLSLEMQHMGSAHQPPAEMELVGECYILKGE